MNGPQTTTEYTMVAIGAAVLSLAVTLAFILDYLAGCSIAGVVIGGVAAAR